MKNNDRKLAKLPNIAIQKKKKITKICNNYVEIFQRRYPFNYVWRK